MLVYKAKSKRKKRNFNPCVGLGFGSSKQDAFCIGFQDKTIRFRISGKCLELSWTSCVFPSKILSWERDGS